MEEWDNQREWLTMRSAAGYLDVSVDFIRTLIREEGLCHYKIRTTLFVRKKDIDALIESHRVV